MPKTSVIASPLSGVEAWKGSEKPTAKQNRTNNLQHRRESFVARCYWNREPTWPQHPPHHNISPGPSCSIPWLFSLPLPGHWMPLGHQASKDRTIEDHACMTPCKWLRCLRTLRQVLQMVIGYDPFGSHKHEWHFNHFIELEKMMRPSCTKAKPLDESLDTSEADFDVSHHHPCNSLQRTDMKFMAWLQMAGDCSSPDFFWHLKLPF